MPSFGVIKCYKLGTGSVAMKSCNPQMVCAFPVCVRLQIPQANVDEYWLHPVILGMYSHWFSICYVYIYIMIAYIFLKFVSTLASHSCKPGLHVWQKPRQWSFPVSDHRFRDVPSDQELEEHGFGEVQERSYFN